MAAKIKIKPLGLRVVVKPEEQGESTAGGLLLPPSAQDDAKPEVGTVVRLGVGDSEIPFQLKEGDTVFFKKYSPDEVIVDDVTYYVLHQDDVVAVIEA